MSTTNSLDLYSLLPAIYRIRDSERGYPLRALLGLISAQAQLVKADIDGLWDDLFIEACADWVIPYIGDLVANNPIAETIVRRRADVANTIYYRRRKGTLTMLEQLARDVTGWDAHAVAFFEELGWSQNLNHLRFHVDTATDPRDPFAVDRVGTVLLRDLDALDRLDGPFDTCTHTVDVRPPCQVTGWYNIHKIGFFLWRLESFFMQEATPRRSAAYADGFHFSPIGNPAPLFVNPATPPRGTANVVETQVQTPIRKVAFYTSRDNYYLQPNADQFYPSHPLATKSLAVFESGKLVDPSRIICGNLSNWPSPTWTPPQPDNIVIDVELGRMAYAQGQSKRDVTVSYTYGFSGNLGGGPYDRTSVMPIPGDPGPAIPASVDKPDIFGTLIRVPSPGINTVNDAVSQWNPAVQPRAVIQIEDNRTYEENVTISFPNTAPPPGTPNRTFVIQAARLQRPAWIGNITVTGGTGAEEFVMNGLLVAGQLRIQGKLGLVEVVHSTLVPGTGLDEQGQPLHPDLPGINVDPPADALQLLVDHSITGALRVPEEMIGVVVRDSIIDSPRRAGAADFSPVLISGNLSPFPTLSSLTPKINITIGDEGPYAATLAAVPHTLAEARDGLQAAIRAAHTTVPFTAARVVSANNRLIVLPGADEAVVIEVAGNDPTAHELRLDPASARQTWAVVSGPLSPFPTLSAPSPAVMVTVGTQPPQTATLAGVPNTLAQARDQLQAAIRAAGGTPEFTGAVVTTVDNQLVAISGGASPLTFATTATDTTTLTQLKLDSERPAIAADTPGDVPGPPTTLLRTTIFGEVHVQQLVLASEVIFNDVVVAHRRQSGCVRFSFVPEGSVTPRRYRCQPDFEIEQRTTDAEQAAAAHGVTLSNADLDAIRDDITGWLQPAFTDIHYGLPAYGQLLVSCPQQIQTGAADGSEMGAFCFLKQPQRVTSLQVRLQEYLPFGLEPGFIYVS